MGCSMGRRSEVADDDIIQAGLGLTTAGELVTGWALRRALGGKGSPPRLMSVWRSQRSNAMHEEFPGGVLPQSEVQEARDGIKAALAFIDRLDGEARDAVRRAEERFELAVEAATEDAVAQAADLDIDLTVANGRLSTLERDLRLALQEAASEKAVAALTLNDKLAAEEAAAALRKEVADLTVKLAVTEERARAADEVAMALRGEVTSLTASLTVAEERARAAQERMEQAEQRERQTRKAAQE